MISYSPKINSISFAERKLDVLRLDLIHPLYGGNKLFKLEYNVQKALNGGYKGILTFGGAHSNHIYASAARCSELNIPSAGIIRGEENAEKLSPTLLFAESNQMSLYFVSRSEYQNENKNFQEGLVKKFPGYYFIPEGGNNPEGVKGCTEILTEEMKTYDYIFCACGTAATYAGLKASASANQKIIGISVLKGEDTLTDSANHWLQAYGQPQINKYEGGALNESVILNVYHLGGYGSFSEQLIAFKSKFEESYGIPLDYVYTARLFYAVFDLVEKQMIPANSSVLIIHSGGLQGNAAYEKRYHLNATR